MIRHPSRVVQFAIFSNLAIGLVRMLEPSDRYLSAGYASAKDAWSIHWWGALFLAAFLLIALFQRTNWQLRLFAFIAGCAWFLWGSLSAISAYNADSGNLCKTAHQVGGCHLAVSYGGAVLYYIVAAIHALIVFRSSGKGIPMWGGSMGGWVGGYRVSSRTLPPSFVQGRGKAPTTPPPPKPRTMPAAVPEPKEVPSSGMMGHKRGPWTGDHSAGPM